VASARPYANLHLAPDKYHASTPPLSILQARCPSCHPTNSVKALKTINTTENIQHKLHSLSIMSRVAIQSLLQPFYDSLDLDRDNPGEPVPEESFTHSHLSWSSVIPYFLTPSFIIHGILPVQFTCLTVFFHNLSPSFLWPTSWPGTLHFTFCTFLHPITVCFSQHLPIPSQPVLL